MHGRTFRKRRSKKLNFLPANACDNNLYSLLKWMGNKGFKPSKKLRPKIFDDTGRGLMAEEVVKPGDVIISIPQKLLITPHLVLNSYLGPFLKRFVPNATGHEVLSVFLMCEHSKGSLSEWHPYIKSLPCEYSIPVYFCQYSLSIIPKSLVLPTQKQCESLKSSFSQLEPLFHELQIAYPAFKDELNYYVYKWAWSCVNTRCIYMECTDDNCSGRECSYHYALAPYLDLLNHSVSVQVKAGYNKENNHYEIVSCNKFEKYSQVFISYGCHDNQKLFLEYGFVIPNNSNDFVSFSLDDVLTAFKSCNLTPVGLQTKIQFIKDNDLLKYSVCSSDGFSWNLNIIIKILLSEYNVRLWNSFLHQEFDQAESHPDFLMFKRTLVNIKINDYEFYMQDLKCPDCLNHQNLISSLCSIHYSVLKNALN